MPELPEVETIARGLRRALPGRRFMGAKADWPNQLPMNDGAGLGRRIAGQECRTVERHGKLLVVGLSRDWLLIHLKMSGRLALAPAAAPPDRHAHVVMALDGGEELRFVDPRKFGRVYLVADPSVVLGFLGPDALDDALDADAFRGLLSQRRGRMKPLLLNQRFIAGLGNIYTDEALWAARIHPLALATDLTAPAADGLLAAIKEVLREAIAAGGTTLPDGGYLGLDGRPGTMARRLRVYRRTGSPCPRCRRPVQRVVVAGRGTHLCPGCQVPPR